MYPINSPLLSVGIGERACFIASGRAGDLRESPVLSRWGGSISLPHGPGGRKAKEKCSFGGRLGDVFDWPAAAFCT